MNKNRLLLASMISIVLVTSCSEEETSGGVETVPEITPAVTVNNDFTRATETTTANLTEFFTTAFQQGLPNYMTAVRYDRTGSEWGTTQGTFYWPVSGDLNLFCYSPERPGFSGTFNIGKDKQELSDFTPQSVAADQKDFVYAQATGNKDNVGGAVDIDFHHALSEITVAAKNDNEAYTIKVNGVRLGNVKDKGTFTFPSADGNTAASWALTGDASDKEDYETTLSSAVTLGKSVAQLGGSDATFMLIPQQLVKSTKAADGNYIALDVTITSQGGAQIYSGWAYAGIDTNWELGKHYNYTLDLSNGAGQDATGSQIISGQGIHMSVTVTDWDGKSVDVPERTIYGGQFDANSIMVKAEKGYYYGIVITRANTFWSNSAVGDASNVIDDNTEWTAEVIWQDIHSRAINFCDAKGNTLSGDTYSGTGKTPLYVKSAGNTPGNVVVGIKKKGSSDYLWSWHLWITEEPKEIAGFMDRNLGATSATPSDGSKTYGLYYQFGRKDPFVANVEIYDINGTKLQTGATVATGKVTFAKAVNTPGTFYTYSSGNGDWASPNNYTDKRWNDITGASGKTLFDPCPPGWKLPEISAFSGFSTSTFTWDATNKGRTYQSNWFPAVGYRGSSNGNVNNLGSSGYYWSESPYNSSFGYDLNFASGYMYPQDSLDRARGFSARCVQE